MERRFLIAYIGSKSVTLNKKLCDNDGRILILDITIDSIDYILINIYNANTEKEQIKVIKSLCDLLNSLESYQNKRVFWLEI